MTEPAVYLFVYGTLQPGFSNTFAQFLHENSQHVGRGIMRGRLYTIGHYPGAVHDPDSPARVYGTIFNITGRPGLLAHLDLYEGISDPPTPTDEYTRTLVPVRSVSAELLCWTYLYNRSLPDRQQILSGCYDPTDVK